MGSSLRRPTCYGYQASARSFFGGLPNKRDSNTEKVTDCPRAPVHTRGSLLPVPGKCSNRHCEYHLSALKHCESFQIVLNTRQDLVSFGRLALGYQVSQGQRNPQQRIPNVVKRLGNFPQLGRLGWVEWCMLHTVILGRSCLGYPLHPKTKGIPSGNIQIRTASDGVVL